jgi:WD40 repeat protein
MVFSHRLVLHGRAACYASTRIDIETAPLQVLNATLRMSGVVELRRALAASCRHFVARSSQRTAKSIPTGLAAIIVASLLFLPMGRPGSKAVASDDPRIKPNESSSQRNVGATDSDPSPPAGAAEKGKDIDGDPLPSGAIARLGSKRYHCSYEPAAMAYLADGKILAQIVKGASWGTLQHWDPNTGRLLSEKRFTGYATPSAVSVSPSANVFATTRMSVDEANKVTSFIEVFDLDSGDRKLELRTSSRFADKLALSPGGRTIAYYGDNKLHIVDVPTQKDAVSEQPIEGRINSLAFSSDGAKLAIGGEGKLFIRDLVAKERPLEVTFPHRERFSPGAVDAMAFSPDGTTIAAGSNDAGPKGVALIDAANGQTLRSFAVPGVTRWYFRAIQFSPDGKLLAANIEDNSGNGVAVWNVESGKLIWRLFGLFGDAHFLSFSPDSRRLAASSEWFSTMCVWDLSSGKPLGDPRSSHEQHPNTIHFLPGDQRLATASDDGTVRIWSLAESRLELTLRHDAGAKDSRIQFLRGMDVSPDGKYAVSSSLDDTVRMWDIAIGREVYRLPGHGRLGGSRSVRFTPDGKQFASWGDDMRVYVWDVATGKAVNEFLARPAGLNVEHDELDNPPFSGDLGGPQLSCASFSKDGGVLYLGLDGIRRFSVPTNKELPKVEVPTGSFSVFAVSPDNGYVFWNQNGKPQRVPLPEGNGSRMVFKSHPVQLRSLSDGKIVTQLDLPGQWADAIAFAPDSRTIAMAVIDDPFRIELRRIPDLSVVARIELLSRAWAVEFSHSGKLLAASLSDSTVLVWDLDHLPSVAEAKVK